MPSFVARCTPSLGRVSIWWARAAENLMHPMGVGKLCLYVQDEAGGGIAEARNALVETALTYDREANPVSHLLWLDDDVLAFPGALLELLNVNQDVASGVYFLKADGPASQPLVWLDADPAAGVHEGVMVPFAPDRVLPAKYTGMGLTLVRLSVYKRMAAELDLGTDRHGRTKFYHTATPDDVREDGLGGIEVGFTEDVYFYRQAARVGVRPWVSTTKHAFGFHTSTLFCCKDCGFRSVEEALAARHLLSCPGHRLREELAGWPEKQFRQWAAGEKIVWGVGGEKVVWG